MKSALFATVALCLMTAGLIKALPENVTFMSRESKAFNGSPVYNEIQFIWGWNQDIWMMRQSHMGLEAAKETWDRLAIVVDKKLKVARFYQVTPGEMKWEQPVEPKAFRARCYACHSNGPRAIRPNFTADNPKVGLKEKLKIALWNLRIEFYGTMKSEAGQPIQKNETPFRASAPDQARELKLSSCVGCHSPQGPRNVLTFEHLATMRFLVQHKLMPPKGAPPIKPLDKQFLL